MIRFRKGRVAVAAASALLVAAGGAMVGAPAAQAVSTVRVGITPNSVASLIYWLSKGGNGIFAQNGLQVTPTVFASATAGFAALAGDSIDIMYSNIPTGIAARVNGDMDIKIIAPSDGMSRRDVARAKTDPVFAGLVDQASICTNPASGINSWKDLAGKKIGASSRNGSSEVGMVDAMVKEGADYKGIQWAVMPPAALVSALTTGKLDAILTGTPFIEQCVAGGGIDKFQPTLALVPDGGPIVVYWAKSSWIAANPTVVKAFQKSIYQAATASRNKANMRAIMTAGSELTKTPLEVMLAGKPPYYWPTMTSADLSVMLDKMVKYGYTKRAANAAEMLIAQYKPGS